VKYAFWIAAVVAAIYVVWQFAAPELANIEFQDDLHDLSAQAGSRIGLSRPPSDEEIRNSIVRKAEKYDIALDPQHVTVKRSGSDQAPTFFLAVDYTVPVQLPGYTYTLHFAPTSAGNRF
jgi:hypothetical protein